MLKKEKGTDDWLEGRNILLADTEFSNAYHGAKETPRPPVIYIGPTRTGLPGVSEFGESDSFGSAVEEVLSGPFCGARLKAAIDLLSVRTRRMYEQEDQEELGKWGTKGLEFHIHKRSVSFVRQIHLRGTVHLSQVPKLSDRVGHRVSH